MLEIDVLTLFPEIFDGPLSASILGRALREEKMSVRIHSLRKWTDDKHKTTDDKPFGGGPGMVMKPEPIYRAVEELKREGTELLLMTPTGSVFDQKAAKELSCKEHILFICGHYEGIDERVIEGLMPRQISIGRYILTNGALAALVVIDAVARLVEGVVGNPDSVENESFTGEFFDYPQYTRPRVYRGMKVPEILISGDHEEIRKWRVERAKEITMKHTGGADNAI